MRKLVLRFVIVGSLLTSCTTISIEEQEDKWAKWDYCEQFSYDGESWMNCMNT